MRFSLTLKLEGVKRYSFFDNDPSFSGWCGVRGSSEVTFRLQNPKEGKQGSIAKCWSRRTGTHVKGKIESRGVELIYPVGGEPGARALIARCNPQGSDEGRSARVERELLAETNEINTSSGLLVFLQPSWKFDFS